MFVCFTSLDTNFILVIEDVQEEAHGSIYPSPALLLRSSHAFIVFCRMEMLIEAPDQKPCASAFFGQA